MGYPINAILIRGQEVQVQVEVTRSEERAEAAFVAEFEGKPFRAPTLEALREQLMKATRRASVSINEPVLRIGLYRDRYDSKQMTFRAEPYIVRGVHAANGNAIVQKEGAKGTEQISGYSERGHWYKPMPEHAIEEIKNLLLEERRIDEAKEAFNVRWSIPNLEAFAKEKVNEKMDDGDKFDRYGR